MRRICLVSSFSVGLFFYLVVFNFVAKQPETMIPENLEFTNTEQTAKENEKINDTDQEFQASLDEYESNTGYLREDLRNADVVVYVDVKEFRETDRVGGYVMYVSEAEVKELLKGRLSSNNFEFYVSADSTYPQKNLLGEQIVFLTRSKETEEKGGIALGQMENTTRTVKSLEKIRKIVNPLEPIDENDENEPYALKSLKKEFAEADAVIYANVSDFGPKDNDYMNSATMTAHVISSFKGKLKKGQSFKYSDRLLFRAINEDDLGNRVLFLTKSSGTFYNRTEHSVIEVKYDLLENLKKISRKN